MNRQTLTAIILIVVLAATAYVWFFQLRSRPAPEISPTNERANLKSDLIRLRRISTIRLDTGIFDNSFFQSLEELPIASAKGEPLPSEGIGRANPFNPF